MESFKTYFHHTFVGPQFCFGLFGNTCIIFYLFIYLFIIVIVCLYLVVYFNLSFFTRFANAFSYYGLVLLTTELFQEGGACGSKSPQATATG